MNMVVGFFVTAVVLYFLWKVLGPPVPKLKGRKSARQVTRGKYTPKDPVLDEISRLRSQERRLKSELRRVREELEEVAFN